MSTLAKLRPLFKIRKKAEDNFFHISLLLSGRRGYFIGTKQWLIFGLARPTSSDLAPLINHCFSRMLQKIQQWICILAVGPSAWSSISVCVSMFSIHLCWGMFILLHIFNVKIVHISNFKFQTLFIHHYLHKKPHKKGIERQKNSQMHEMGRLLKDMHG